MQWGLKLKGLVILCVLCFSGVAYGAGEVVLKTEMEKLSYVLGVAFGDDIKKQGVGVDADLVANPSSAVKDFRISNYA